MKGMKLYEKLLIHMGDAKLLNPAVEISLYTPTSMQTSIPKSNTIFIRYFRQVQSVHKSSIGSFGSVCTSS